MSRPPVIEPRSLPFVREGLPTLSWTAIGSDTNTNFHADDAYDGFAHTRSVSNNLMIDARLPTQQVIDALAARDVFVGRAWPVWPTHVRVTIGSAADMERFKLAFLEVVANPGPRG